MAAVLQVIPPRTSPRPASGEAQLAHELGDAFGLIAQCWSRGLTVPDEVLDVVDGLLDRVEDHLERRDVACCC